MGWVADPPKVGVEQSSRQAETLAALRVAGVRLWQLNEETLRHYISMMPRFNAMATA